ncbi:MAG: hypothetical protein MJZ87_07035, partial [Bacteroidales bacterium]|nr:hypothetical protein [Bacteroidales bacterium]
LSELPAVTTDSASAVTISSAKLHGTVTSMGDYPTASVGFKYGTSENAMNTVKSMDKNSAEPYDIAVTELLSNTTYYYQAFAAENIDTVYGAVKSFTTEEPTATFTCGTSTVSDVDGNSYNTVKIGDQCWMKENLRTKTSTGNTYYPNEDENNVASYGLLYDWAAVMQGSSSSEANPSGVQGICPTGWHVPSDAEWTQLFDYVSSQSAYCCGGNTGSIAKALASTTSWNYSINDCAVGRTRSSNNATGFSALPAGIYAVGYYGGYGSFCTSAFFWSTTEYYDFGTVRYFESNDAGVRQNTDNKSNGYSVRCLRDAADGSELGENESNGTPEEPAADMSVTTDNANTMTSTSAILYGNVTNLGGNVSVNAGFKYGTSETAMNTKVDDAVSATGLYSINITDLTANTTYYYAAYVATATDTAYGDILNFTTEPVVATFTCGTSTVKDVDGIKYNTVQIGDQCWMKENLRTKTSTGNTYYPNEDENNVASYGLLYDWAAVMQGSSSSEANPSGVQGICPTGWHVPSDAEWTQLFDYVSSQSAYCCGGNTGSIAKALASTTSWNYSINDCAVGRTRSSNNATGFSALPAGIYAGSYYGGYGGFCTSAFFWSTTEYYEFGTVRYFESNDAGVRQNADNKSNGYSVRCVKDAEPEPETAEMSVSTDSANTVTSTAATLYGNVTDLGGNASVNAGFKYGTSETTMNTKVGDAVSATGLYSIDITGLTDNTTYYFKAYAATNATDTVWGAVKSFTTLSEQPESGTKDTITFIPNGGMGTMSPMMVAPESNITLTANTFAHAGNWQFTGWNTAADGSGDSFLDEQVLTSEGNLTLYAQWHTWCTGTPNTHINEIGTDRIEYLEDNQNNRYQVIQIRNQCWMRENLRTTKYADSTDIEQGSTTSNSVAYWYYPNDNADNKQTCGLLYNWKAVRNGAEPFVSYPKGMQGICPTGWHVPSKSEWTQMVDSLRAHSEYGCGNNDKIAKALASPQGWLTNQQSCNVGTDPYTNNAAGFSAIPAGSYTGSYSYFGDRAYFWTSDQNGIDKAFYRSLYSYLDTLYRGAGAAFSNAYSVRCVRDMVTPDGPETENCGTLTDQDGNTYRTVIIGEQCWMRDNLRTLTNNGYGNVYTPTSNQIYGYDAEIYGRLYDWAAVMQGADNSNNVPSGVQGICPTGWHVPSDAEWIEMIDFVKSQLEYRCDVNKDTTIAKALASTKGWYNSPNNCTVGHLPSENNAVGFSAIPAGYYSNNILYTAYDQANYATTTKTSSNNEIWCRSFGSNGSKVYHVIGSINKYYSVRCVKN